MLRNPGAFTPLGNSAKLAVTDVASAGVQLQGSPATVKGFMVSNVGSKSAFLCAAASATNAVIPTGTGSNMKNGICIPAGVTMVLNFEANSYFSAICAAGESTTLYITRGEGN